jgi:putative transposase
MRLDGLLHNHKKVYQVYCEMKLNLPQRTKERLMNRPAQLLICPSEVNKASVVDFMRDTLYDGRPFRTFNAINEGNLEGSRIEVGRHICSLRVTRIMSELVECFGKPGVIRLGNGPDLTADAFTIWAKEQGIELCFIQPGKPNQNVFIERFNKSLREEVLNANLFNMLSEEQNVADHWLTDCNECFPISPWAICFNNWSQRLLDNPREKSS